MIILRAIHGKRLNSITYWGLIMTKSKIEKKRFVELKLTGVCQICAAQPESADGSESQRVAG